MPNDKNFISNIGTVVYTKLISITGKKISEAKAEILNLFSENRAGRKIMFMQVLGITDLINNWVNDEYVISKAVYGEIRFDCLAIDNYAHVSIYSYSINKPYYTFIDSGKFSSTITN